MTSDQESKIEKISNYFTSVMNDLNIFERAELIKRIHYAFCQHCGADLILDDGSSYDCRCWDDL